MKNISNINKAFFAFSLFLLLVLGCNPSSTANLLFDGPNYDKANNNAIVFGRLVDKETKESLVGANVILIDYKLGAATDNYGNYFIKDIPPGVYNIKATYVGYERSILPDIKLDSNKRYLIDFELQPQNIPGMP
jgi:hypothetical protein